MYNALKIEQQLYKMWQGGHWPVMPEGYNLLIVAGDGTYKLIGIHHPDPPPEIEQPEVITVEDIRVVLGGIRYKLIAE